MKKRKQRKARKPILTKEIQDTAANLVRLRALDDLISGVASRQDRLVAEIKGAVMERMEERLDEIYSERMTPRKAIETLRQAAVTKQQRRVLRQFEALISEQDEARNKTRKRKK